MSTPAPFSKTYANCSWWVFAQPYLVNHATKPASTFYSYELKLPAVLQQVTGHLASKTPPGTPLTQEVALIMSSLNTPENPQQRLMLPVCRTYLLEIKWDLGDIEVLYWFKPWDEFHHKAVQKDHTTAFN